MSGVKFLRSWLLCALFVPLSEPSAQLLTCHEVRSSFQFLYPGTKWAPETPVSGKPVMLGEEIVGFSCLLQRRISKQVSYQSSFFPQSLAEPHGCITFLSILTCALCKGKGLQNADE